MRSPQVLVLRQFGPSSNADREWVVYGYDLAGNRLTRDNQLSGAAGQDEKYAYDGLWQVSTLDRGTWDGSTIDPKVFGQAWTFDQTGNWANFKRDDNGDGTWDLNQNRTHNLANEIATIQVWGSVVHDAPARILRDRECVAKRMSKDTKNPGSRKPRPAMISTMLQTSNPSTRTDVLPEGRVTVRLEPNYSGLEPPMDANGREFAGICEITTEVRPTIRVNWRSFAVDPNSYLETVCAGSEPLSGGRGFPSRPHISCNCVWMSALSRMTYEMCGLAWNRLVEVKETDGSGNPTTTVAAYAYDGFYRRTKKVIGASTRDYYYSLGWQVLEERVAGALDRQFVWGIRHIDDLVLRDRGAERLYAVHDAMHVTAVTNAAGAVQERYGYEGFGKPRFMDASFGARASSSYDWETLFAPETGQFQLLFWFLHPGVWRGALEEIRGSVVA